MENSTNEVYAASKSYCRVGKITPKDNNEIPNKNQETESQNN